MIVLSVAHSLLDRGATSADGALREHDVSWTATQACEVALAARHIPTAIMRFGDLDQLTYLRKKAQAINGMSPDAAVELHCNASADYPDAVYSEVIHHAWSVPGKGLAHAIAGAMGDAMSRSHRWPSRGAVGRDDLWLLNHTHCPTVIVEGVFISTPEQSAWLSSGGAEAYGHVVAAGIMSWLDRTGGIDGH